MRTINIPNWNYRQCTEVPELVCVMVEAAWTFRNMHMLKRNTAMTKIVVTSNG